MAGVPAFAQSEVLDPSECIDRAFFGTVHRLGERELAKELVAYKEATLKENAFWDKFRLRGLEDLNFVATKQSSAAALARDDMSFLSCTELAERFRVNEDALRGRLGRWRRAHLDDGSWVEVTGRKSREPSYLYRVANVLSVLESLASKVSTTPGKRSSRKKKRP